MHSLTEVGTNVPAFLAKLWKLVEDHETNDLICWSENGASFIIHNQAQFCRELLPLYYKHNNMASFVRQLNMYGFHKKVSVDAGGLKLDRDEMEFAHPCFLRGQAFLLENIKRKIAEPGRGTVKAPEVINRVLGDVKQMKGRQENLDSKLTAMKRENEALWRELALLRQKHLKQQQIVNKLIQFLLTVVQSPGSRLGIKRRYPPLMLNDREHHHHHHHKHKHRQGASTSTHVSTSAPSSPPPHRHPFSDDEAAKSDDTRSGPVIHELDPNSEYILPDQQQSDEEEEEEEGVTGQVTTPPPTMSHDQDASSSRSPASPIFEAATLTEALLEEASSSADQAGQMALLSQAGSNGPPTLGGADDNSVSREEMDSHLEAMQSDLEGLKELLRSDGCSLDANTLLSLFADDPISLGMGLPSQEGKEDDADVIGSELIAYNPTLFDLTDEADVGGVAQLFEGGDEQGSLLGAEQPPSLESIVQSETETELATPHPRLEGPDFPEPAKKRRK